MREGNARVQDRGLRAAEHRLNVVLVRDKLAKRDFADLVKPLPVFVELPSDRDATRPPVLRV